MKQINLPPLPRSWNEVATADLEALHALYLQQLDENSFLMKAFLVLSHLKVLTKTRKEDGQTVYLLRHHGFRPWLRRERIPLLSYQIQYWITNQLAFLLKECDRVVFPYPVLRLHGHEFCGVSDMLSDVSWQQYSQANNMLKLYRDTLIASLSAQKRGASPRRVNQLLDEADGYRARFLAALFTLRTPDGKSEFVDDQTETNFAHFLRFPEAKFMGVQLFWDGMMRYYQRTFPKLFKEHGEEDIRTDMLKMEASTIVTLMDRWKLPPQTVYDANGILVLEQLERISREAEAISEQNARMRAHR